MEWHIVWQSEKSLDNWTTRFDLHCAPSWKIALPGAGLFISWVCTTFWISPMADLYGRKYFFLTGQIIMLFVHVCMHLTRSFNVIIAMSFVSGFFVPLRMIGFNYLLELVPKRKQIASGVTYLTLEALLFIFSTVLFRYTKDMDRLFFLTWVFNLISITGTFFLPESP